MPVDPDGTLVKQNGFKGVSEVSVFLLDLPWTFFQVQVTGIRFHAPAWTFSIRTIIEKPITLLQKAINLPDVDAVQLLPKLERCHAILKEIFKMLDVLSLTADIANRQTFGLFGFNPCLGGGNFISEVW